MSNNLLNLPQVLQNALFSRLLSPDTSFKLVIDDVPIILGGQGVYLTVNGQNNQRTGVLAIVKKDKNSENVSVKVQGIFDGLNDTVYSYKACTGNFSEQKQAYNPHAASIAKSQMYSVDFAMYPDFNVEQVSVDFDTEFGIVYINSAKHCKLKSLVSNTSDLTNPDNTLKPLLETFTAESVLKYITLVEVLFKKTLNGTLRSKSYFVYVNNIFRSVGNTKHEQGFLQLFHETPTLYNPFTTNRFLYNVIGKLCIELEAKGLMFNVQAKVQNKTGVTVKCITPLDLCKGLGLPKKLGFSTSSAMLYLAGLALQNNIYLPTTNFGRYVDQLEGLVYETPPIDSGYIKPVATLWDYIGTYRDVLSEGTDLDVISIYQTLSSVYGG